MKVLFSVGFFLVGAFFISAVLAVSRRDNVHAEGDFHILQIGDKTLKVNFAGCAEASLVCDFYSVAGGHGGGECDDFYALYRVPVSEFCKREFPPSDGRKGVGGR